MHVLLVADGRSPITRRWIAGLRALQHEVTVVSTFPCTPVQDVRETFLLPVAFSKMAGGQAGGKNVTANTGRWRKVAGKVWMPLLALRYRLGPLSLLFYARRFRSLVNAVQPDIVHALRIPFEGMLASYTPAGIPMLVSIWGNDFTLHANGSRLMRAFTQRTLRRADGLLADAQRDIRLAKSWGFPAQRPMLVVPGGGGIDLREIHNLNVVQEEPGLYTCPEGVPLVINPRGLRPGYVRNDTFFQAIPLILERKPDVHFICPAMENQPEALYWVERLRIQKSVHLLPTLPQPRLWSLFSRCELSVSISEHDGTPNSLLEAMACGCFPVAGDLDSLREWITPGANGLLVEASRPESLAAAVILALEDPALRTRAAELNLELISSRAEISLVRAQIETFYRRFFKGNPAEEEVAAGGKSRAFGEE
ncbi:MAG: glycosyltransferase family 4 protein [Anaerolineaceae bacterium]|nr:glycosyltransferase family 4 protein [Anaerolineaceae bacterium]